MCSFSFEDFIFIGIHFSRITRHNTTHFKLSIFSHHKHLPPFTSYHRRFHKLTHVSSRSHRATHSSSSRDHLMIHSSYHPSRCSLYYPKILKLDYYSNVDTKIVLYYFVLIKTKESRQTTGIA